MIKVLKFRYLEIMPFDRWDSDKHCFVHATGREFYADVFGNGNPEWFTEWENDENLDFSEAKEVE